jgi:hypothetical protein
MDKIAQKFRSHRDSETAGRDYYRSLTPQQRLDLLLDLIAQTQPDENKQGFARVYRVAKLHGR